MDVLMPQLGETVAEGKITKWFKSAGDKVAPGDNLFEIETDKVSMEVPATEAGILLGRLAPSGAHGRILARDVETAIGNRAAPAARSTGPSVDKVKALYEPGSYEEVPLDAMRRTIAARLVEAKQTIPHFYLSGDVTIERLISVREEANAGAKKDADGKPAFKLSLNDFVIKAWALALARVPAANAVWAEDRILRFRHADIGVVV